MTAEFVASQRTGHSVAHTVACRVLGVAPSAFHKHRKRPPTTTKDHLHTTRMIPARRGTSLRPTLPGRKAWNQIDFSCVAFVIAGGCLG